MSHLHPERWRELEPEFIVAALLQEAHDTIEHAKERTEGLARAEYFVHHGLQALHPCTRDPEAREEFSQRKAGTFEPGKNAPAAPQASDSELKAMAAKIRELEAKLASQPKADDPKNET